MCCTLLTEHDQFAVEAWESSWKRPWVYSPLKPGSALPFHSPTGPTGQICKSNCNPLHWFCFPNPISSPHIKVSHMNLVVMYSCAQYRVTVAQHGKYIIEQTANFSSIKFWRHINISQMDELFVVFCVFAPRVGVMLLMTYCHQHYKILECVVIFFFPS